MSVDERRLLVLLAEMVRRHMPPKSSSMTEMSRLLDRVERAAEREAVETCR